MAKEIVAWCDVHLARDEHVSGTEVRVALDGGKQHAIDLCEQCDKELVEPLRALLQSEGQPIIEQQQRVVATVDRPHVCPVCSKSYSQRASYGKHVRDRHGMSVRDVDDSSALEAARASAEPHVELDVPLKLYACPDCDRSFDTPQGRGAHRNRLHGYVGEKAQQHKRAQ